jgi:hypothetical protein
LDQLVKDYGAVPPAAAPAAPDKVEKTPPPAAK